MRVGLHLLLVWLPQETKVQACCRRDVLQTSWKLQIIFQDVHSIPLQPLSQSPQSHWERRRPQQLIHRLALLAEASSLLKTDTRQRSLDLGSLLLQPGVQLIFLLTPEVKELKQRGGCLWTALKCSELHFGIWVKVGTYLAGQSRQRTVQMLDQFEGWFQKACGLIFHSGIEREWTCLQQMEVCGRVGWRKQMDELQSVKKKSKKTMTARREKRKHGVISISHCTKKSILRLINAFL